MSILQHDPMLTLPGMLDGLARAHGDRPALIGTTESFSYAMLADRVDQIARWATSHCSNKQLDF